MDIKEIFKECLLKKEESFVNSVTAEGVISIVIFNQNRLEKYRAEIEVKLNELPNFKVTIKDLKWDKQLEQLLQLGIGLDIVKVPIYQKEKLDFSIAS